jgi:SpoIID/LytB domain protein
LQVRVGITGNDLVSHGHKLVMLSAASGLVAVSTRTGAPVISIAGNQVLSVSVEGNVISLRGDSNAPVQFAEPIAIRAKVHGNKIEIVNLKREGRAKPPAYEGIFEVAVRKKASDVLLVLICDLETYVAGVIASEMPASYELEAIKAQTLAARTYALHPRISHADEGFNVCDSYLCCQFFAGAESGITPRQAQAISQTKGEILTFEDKPILALFSAVAGGHTEDYQNCFSDPVTGAFPPAAIPYLVGVAEGQLPKSFPSVAAMKELFATPHPDTCDAWSSFFRWQVHFSSAHLDGHMHHVISSMQADPNVTPFIHTPESGQFGHIQGFEIKKRGVSGVAIELSILTSEGTWRIEKELLIRQAFANPDLQLKRLKSARIFFDTQFDKLGLLSHLTVFGFGSGHGVGLQQQGAQGLALQGRDYRQILKHYFHDVQISKI